TGPLLVAFGGADELNLVETKVGVDPGPRAARPGEIVGLGVQVASRRMGNGRQGQQKGRNRYQKPQDPSPRNAPSSLPLDVPPRNVGGHHTGPESPCDS